MGRKKKTEENQEVILNNTAIDVIKDGKNHYMIKIKYDLKTGKCEISEKKLLKSGLHNAIFDVTKHFNYKLMGVNE